jgi:hypothetical protein
MSRSTHNPKNKTQKVFRGWDYSEIIEWMEIDYKKTKTKLIKFKLSVFCDTIKKAFKELFDFKCYMSQEQIEIQETKKALDILMNKISDQVININPIYINKVKGLRTYVTKLATFDNTYIQPLWKGLSEIKSDTEFVRYVKHFLESLWD